MLTNKIYFSGVTKSGIYKFKIPQVPNSIVTMDKIDENHFITRHTFVAMGEDYKVRIAKYVIYFKDELFPLEQHTPLMGDITVR